MVLYTAPLKYTFIAALVYGLGMETIKALRTSLQVNCGIVSGSRVQLSITRTAQTVGALAPPLLLFEGISHHFLWIQETSAY